jgi:hypothetical protein
MRRNKTTEWLKSHPIIHEKTLILENPFKIINATHLTDIQEMVHKYAKIFKFYTTFAFSASCGAGKTLAGIYLIHRFGVKTLIVSSRSAINDQWEYILKSLYPKLKVKSLHHKCENPDVYIYSPQYLTQDLKRIPDDVRFIIYDEIHSIVSDNFGKCVEEPIKRLKQYSTQKEKDEHTPYMLALSGTYPKNNKIIDTIFGKDIPTVSKITDIPVYVYDIHVEYARNVLKTSSAFADCISDNKYYKPKEVVVKPDQISSAKGVVRVSNGDNETSADKSTEQSTPVLTSNIKSLYELPERVLIKLDNRYTPLDDYQYIDYIIEHNIFSKHNIKISPVLRGFVITENIDSSVYCAIRLSEHYHCNVILMRSVDEPSFVITPKVLTEFDIMVLNQEYLKPNYEKLDMKKLNLPEVLDKHNISIICGCYHRLKEGISVENAVWGVCTKFIYSDISRVQILGRIRRTSNNPLIQNAKRVFLVNSGKIMTNQYMLMKNAQRFRTKMDYSKIKTMYDFQYEKTVFERENYIYSVLE